LGNREDFMSRLITIVTSILAMTAMAVGLGLAQPPEGFGPGKGPGKMKRQMQDKIGGVPKEILDKQSLAEINPPSIAEAVAVALKAADKAALPLVDKDFHKGRTLTVPEGPFKTVQSAIDAAESGDIVLVKPGTYFELIVMRNGVKLVSDSADGGDELVAVKGARMKLPRRALRTILDGSKSQPSHRGMIDFNPGVGRNTIVDGFTVQNLPKQDHHTPGHAHAVNIRGASPIIMKCFVRKNGSTGIGNHVVYYDQDSPVPQRDFRWANVEHWVEPVIYRNVISENVGLGVGNNHFSSAYVLGNELFQNSDAELGHEPSPGMGAKHGAAPVITGNIVHDNPGGGILSKAGEPQGTHPIDRPTHPTVVNNVVYRNGKIRPQIACDGGGSDSTPVCFVGNFVFEAGAVGMALRNGAVGILEKNLVSGSEAPGIAINAATALKLNHNRVTGSNAPGFVIKAGSNVLEMVGNAADANLGPRFMLRDATIVSSGT
jgi:hypothetical protein